MEHPQELGEIPPLVSGYLQGSSRLRSDWNFQELSADLSQLVPPSAPPPGRAGPHGWRPLRVELGGSPVIGHPAERQTEAVASRSPSGSDYITLHRRKLRAEADLVRCVHSRSTH